MNTNFFRAIIRLLSCLLFVSAVFGLLSAQKSSDSKQTFSLRLDQPDSVAMFQALPHDPPQYTELEINCYNGKMTIPNLSKYHFQRIVVDQFNNSPDSIVDLSPLASQKPVFFAFSRGIYKNFPSISTDLLVSVSGMYEGEINASEWTTRSFPNLESLSLGILHGKLLDLTGMPQLKKLCIQAAPELQEIKMAPGIKLHSFAISAPNLTKLPAFDSSELTFLALDFSGVGLNYMQEPSAYLPASVSPTWSLEHIAGLETPKLKRLMLCGLSGEHLLLPKGLPALDELSLEHLNIRSLNGMDGISIKKISLGYLDQLRNFDALPSIQNLESIVFTEVPAVSCFLPDRIPAGCYVSRSPEPLENPKIVWMIYLLGLTLLSLYTVGFQLLTKRKKNLPIKGDSPL